jgi:uncharacterized pyridoxal phosphate-containing UPF0001 family protein
MTEKSFSISENVKRIRCEIESAALSCGRNPKEVELMR